MMILKMIVRIMLVVVWAWVIFDVIKIILRLFGVL